MQKVVHVYLIFEKKDFYFGSIAAIYDILSPEQIGVKYNTLRNYIVLHTKSELLAHFMNKA